MKVHLALVFVGAVLVSCTSKTVPEQYGPQPPGQERLHPAFNALDLELARRAEAIMRWLTNAISPETYVNVMGQYQPQ